MTPGTIDGREIQRHPPLGKIELSSLVYAEYNPHSHERMMTTEQLMAIPEDGKERWLINGELREKDYAWRTRDNARITGRLGYLLSQWNASQPAPRGEMLGSGVGVQLQKNPDTTVGVDIAYIAPETAASSPADYVDGAPILIAGVLSPSDDQEEIAEKVTSYLQARVKRVLVADPAFETITVYRPDVPAELFNAIQRIDLNLVMPELHIALRDVFQR